MKRLFRVSREEERGFGYEDRVLISCIKRHFLSYEGGLVA